MYSPDLTGTLVIRVFSAQRDNATRGRPVVVYRFYCRYGDAREIADAWVTNNPGIQPYDKRFELGSIPL